MLSHPIRVRGLKHIAYATSADGSQVASYTGAWIETKNTSRIKRGRNVASYTGAWIETQAKINKSNQQFVASYTGAWIETGVDYRMVHNTFSRILYGCVD